ncbi:MAG: nucleotide exchange factor GrpE [Planctomycetota bacterium]
MTAANQGNDYEAGQPDGVAAAAAAAEHDPAIAETASQTAETAVLQAKLDDLQSRLVRTLADLENYRRRAQRELEESRRFESLRLVRDLLPALDGLNRALASGEQTADPQALLSGIRMVAQQFRDILRGHSAEPIEALGQPFNPNLHEALTQVPSAEHPPMTVVQVVEMGYRMHDRVVRPARVIVSFAPPTG